MFNFTPLLGAQTSSPASQSLLEFEGGIKILVDLGWDTVGDGSENNRHGFDVRQLKELEKIIPTLSLVLLTHPTTAHLGAFAHVCKHFPQFRQVPIYATTPVIALGQTLLQDMYASTPAAAGVIPDNALGGDVITSPSTAGGENGYETSGPEILYQAPTADEIRSYFALINDLKYSQPHEPLPSPFSPPLNGLMITAYSAGHTPGGTIWHVQHGMESVVYAVDWNQTKENILSGAAWLGSGATGGAEVIEQLRKPTALICSTKGVERTPLARTRRDDRLLDMLRKSVQRGGVALVPSDSSARVLEIAYMLDKAYADETGDNILRGAKIYIAGKGVGSAIHYAKSMLEWMNDSVVRELESRDLTGKDGQAIQRGPFDFRFVKVVEKKRRLNKILEQQGPRIILASDEGLDWGYSRDILERIASDKDSCVILTEDYGLRSPAVPGSEGLGQLLWKLYQDKDDGVAVETGVGEDTYEQAFNDNRDLVFEDVSRQVLEGNELTIYQSFLATQKQLQNTMQSNGATGLETIPDVVDEASSDASSSSDESEDDRQGKALNFSAVLNQANKARGAGPKEITGINALLKEPGLYDWDVRGKKGREAMFPFPQKRRRVDDFGEIIRPEDYLRAEERDEIDGQDLREGEGKDAELGQKRKWDDAILNAGLNKSTQGGATKKRKTKTDGMEGVSAPDSGYQTAETNAESEDSDSDSESETESGDPNIPSKLVRSRKTLKANLRIAFVDFAGIHDQRSLTMLLPLIQPRKLLLVGGTGSETNWLANEMARKMNLQLPETEGPEQADILMPLNGETIVASMDTHAWTVKLSRSLTRRLQWQTVRGLGVVTLTGRLEPGKPPEEKHDEDADEAARKKKLKLSKLLAGDASKEEDMSDTEKAPGQNISAVIPASNVAPANLPPVLDVVPTNLAAATRTIARPLHVGDLRLADLRKLLSASGHRAEFRGEGTLVVDGIVAVRKTTGGRIEVEGGEGRGSSAPTAGYMQTGAGSAVIAVSSFYEVKKKIYEGLAVIAGG